MRKLSLPFSLALLCAAIPLLAQTPGGPWLTVSTLPSAATAVLNQPYAWTGATTANTCPAAGAGGSGGSAKAGCITFDGTSWAPVGGGSTTVNGVPCAPSSSCIVPVVSSGAHSALGDSITTGTGASVLSAAYMSLLSADENSALSNLAISGDQVCDVAQLQAFKFVTPTDTGNPLYTVLIGTNDANVKGVGAYETVFGSCNRAVLSWLAVPVSSRIQAQSCTKTGTWSNDSDYASGVGITSTANGSTASCALSTNGGPLYIWYKIIDGNGGVFSYSLDGASSVSVNSSTATSISTQNGGTKGVSLVRIPVSAGSHTLLMTVTSSTGAGNIVGLLGVGSAPAVVRRGRPAVWTGGVIRQQNDAKSSITAQYDSDVQNDVSLLHGDGLPVYFVPVRNFVNSTTDMADTLHPNDAGHGHLRDAFESVEQFVPWSVGTGNTETLISILSPSGVSSVTFSPIPAGYKDLRIVIRGRSDAAAWFAETRIQPNGDTGANYDWEYNITSGALVAPGQMAGQTSGTIGWVFGASSTSGLWGVTNCVVYDYTNASIFKPWLTFSGIKTSASGANTFFQQSNAGWWKNTAAVSSLAVSLSVGNFVAGSTVSLYGVN